MKTASALLRNFLNGQFYGMNFTGAGQYVVVPAGPWSSFAAPFTVECLMQSTDAGAQKCVASIAGGSTGWRFGIDNGKPYYLVGEPGGVHYAEGVIGTTTCNNNMPHHLCIVYNLGSSGNVSAFIDGAAVGSVGIAAVNCNSSANMTIGEMNPGGTQYTGVVDELRVYARALPAAEIAEHSRGFFRSDYGLVGYWPFDEGSGSTVADLSIYAKNGTRYGSPVFAAFNPFPGRDQELRTADLYTFTLAGAEVYRWTSADIDIRYGGNTFLANGPLFNRTRITQSVGLEVAEMELQLSAHPSDMLGSSALMTAARQGAFDGALVRVERAIMPSWGNTCFGTVLQFLGTVASAELRRLGVTLTVRSQTQLLNVQLPRNLFQAGCRWTLYDSGCTLSKAAFHVDSSVNAGSTNSQINCGLGQGAGYFDLGTITFTSGANNGATRSVKTYTTGVLKLSLPLLSTPQVGDTFIAYPGCDKQLSTCVNKFSNRINYGGEPFIPIPETAA